jgi:hypothetical protein
MVCQSEAKPDNFTKSMVNPPRGVSLTNFFADWMTKWKDTVCFIRIKIRGKRLRFIECELKDDQLTLFYWVGEGWRQNQISNKRCGVKHCEYDYQQNTIYRMQKINRVKKGTRNRGRKSPGKSSVIQLDRVELNDPGRAARVAMMAVATITKSLEWDERINDRLTLRRAIVLDGDDFTYDTMRHITMQVEYTS